MGKMVMIIRCKRVKMILLILERGKQKRQEYCLTTEDELCNDNRTASISVHLFTLHMH